MKGDRSAAASRFTLHAHAPVRCSLSVAEVSCRRQIRTSRSKARATRHWESARPSLQQPKTLTMVSAWKWMVRVVQTPLRPILGTARTTTSVRSRVARGRSHSLTCTTPPRATTPKPTEGASTLTGPRCCSPVSARARELRREEVDERPLQGQHRVLRQLLLLRLRLPCERVQGVGSARSGHTHGVDVARHACGGQGCCQGGRGGGEWDQSCGRWSCRVPAAMVV